MVLITVQISRRTGGPLGFLIATEYTELDLLLAFWRWDPVGATNCCTLFPILVLDQYCMRHAHAVWAFVTITG